MAPSPRDTAGTSNESDGRPGAFPGLAALLWTVRGSLEAVLYALVVVRLVVTDGSPRWLPRADGDLQDALEGLRATEVLRAAEVDDMAQAARVQDRNSLEALAEVAPEPWRDVFDDHRDALRLLMTEIDAAIAENRQVLQAASRRNRMPASLHGARDESAVTASAAYRSALATLDAVPQLSLQDFLA